MTLDQDSALSRAFGRRNGGWKSCAPLRPGCGPPVPSRAWRSVGTARACSSGHGWPRLRAGASGRSWRGRARRASLRGGGVVARVDRGRGVPGSCVLHSPSRCAVLPLHAPGLPEDGRALWRHAGDAVRRARTNPCSCVVTYDHARRARIPRNHPPPTTPTRTHPLHPGQRAQHPASASDPLSTP